MSKQLRHLEKASPNWPVSPSYQAHHQFNQNHVLLLLMSCDRSPHNFEAEPLGVESCSDWQKIYWMEDSDSLVNIRYQMAGDASFFSPFLTRNSSSCNCIHYKMFLTSCLSHKWLCLLSIHVMRIPKAPSFSYNYWLKFSSRKIAFISKAIAANLLLRVENITSLFNFSTTLKHRQ